MKYTITKDNLRIFDSYLVRKKNFQGRLNSIKAIHSNSDIWKRSPRSMRMEWATHNGLYAMGILRDKTKDVDLNYPQKWYAKIGYALCGNLFWLFIK